MIPKDFITEWRQLFPWPRPPGLCLGISLCRSLFNPNLTSLNDFLYDEPDIEFKAKFSSSKNAIIFAETIRNIRDNIKIHVINLS